MAQRDRWIRLRAFSGERPQQQSRHPDLRNRRTHGDAVPMWVDVSQWSGTALDLSPSGRNTSTGKRLLPCVCARHELLRCRWTGGQSRGLPEDRGHHRRRAVLGPRSRVRAAEQCDALGCDRVHGRRIETATQEPRTVRAVPEALARNSLPLCSARCRKPASRGLRPRTLLARSYWYDRANSRVAKRANCTGDRKASASSPGASWESSSIAYQASTDCCTRESRASSSIALDHATMPVSQDTSSTCAAMRCGG